MSNERTNKCFDLSLPEASERLFNLGKIIATDMCVNNPDRVPALWEGHQGNPTNLIFEVLIDEKLNEEQYHDPNYTELNFADTIAIDNKCFAIAQTDLIKIESLKMYLQQLETFVTDIFSDLKVIMNGQAPITEYGYPSIIKSLDFIRMQTNFDMKGRPGLKILEGIVIALFNIATVGFKLVKQTL